MEEYLKYVFHIQNMTIEEKIENCEKVQHLIYNSEMFSNIPFDLLYAIDCATNNFRHYVKLLEERRN